MKLLDTLSYLAGKPQLEAKAAFDTAHRGLIEALHQQEKSDALERAQASLKNIREMLHGGEGTNGTHQ